MKTDQLIDNLSTHMKPVKTFTPTGLSLLWLAATVMLVLMVVTVGLGLRADLEDISTTPHFILMVASLAVMFITGVFGAFSGAIPGRETADWLVIAPFAAFVFFAISVLPPMVVPGETQAASPVGVRCTLVLFALGIIPLLFLLALLRSLAVTRLGHVARTAGFAAMGLGAFGLSLYCTSRECLHLFTYHCLPVLFVGVLTEIVAARFLRW